MDGFEIIRKIGAGAYSEVYHVRRIQDSLEYALKVVRLSNLDEKMLQNSLNEVRILASLRDSFIVSYKEAFLDSKTECLYIVMEYVDGGDLSKRVFNLAKEGRNFQEAEIWRIFI